MVRAVLLGSTSALLVAGVIWFGWFEPRLREPVGPHYYPPVVIPTPAYSDPKAGGVARDGPNRQVALLLPSGRPHTTAVGPQAALELLPDLRIRTPSDLVLVGSRSAGTLRLKFTTVIWNGGDGPVEVRGSQSTEAELRVVQYVHRQGDQPRPERAVGSFDYEHRHGHLHLGGFAHYELWSLDAGGQPLELVAENAKVGFCLMDNLPIDEALAPAEPVYDDCDAEVQGISVGYGDIYVAALYEQDLNVSQLPDGRYRLINTVNPDYSVRELDYDNNSAQIDVQIRGQSVARAPSQ